MKKKHLYPGVEEAEKEREKKRYEHDEEPDFVDGVVPNYAKFEKLGWDTEKILVWLNID